MPKLYLIPSLLDEGDWQQSLPAGIFGILTETTHLIVENIRTARRFIKLVNREIDIDKISFLELNEQSKPDEISGLLRPMTEGFNMAVISEAGCPGVADPGQAAVRLAHERGFQVVPVSGPSSVILALMASGLNGQNFAFNGYLPVKPPERVKALLNLERKVITEKQTQIFIETPYRNNQMTADILKTCASGTRLCIAANLTGPNEYIKTQSIGQWKKNVPDLNKQPAVFLLGK